jgi:hypothetical protein
MQSNDHTPEYERLLDFIKDHNPNITFGVIFTVKEGRKHRLWCGSEAKPAFRISIKPIKL